MKHSPKTLLKLLLSANLKVLKIQAYANAGGSAEAAVLDWEQPDMDACRGPYSLVIGADLVYTAGAVDHLCVAIQVVLGNSPDCRVLLAHCSRHTDVDEQLFGALSTLGLQPAVVAASQKDRRVQVYACGR